MTQMKQPKPDDPAEDWSVYADALQVAGDPRGGLIALNQAVAAGEGASRRDRYLTEHAEAIFGPVATHRRRLEIDWRYCLAQTVSIHVEQGDDLKAWLRALLRSPLAPSVRCLRLVARTPSTGARVNLGPGIALLAKQLPESCAELHLVDERAKNARMLVSSDYGPGPNLVELGSLDAVWAIEHLQRLVLHVADMEQIDLGTVDAPSLESFAFLGLRWASAYGRQSEMAQGLAEASWPRLRELALRLPETFTYSWPDQHGAYVPEDRYEEYNEYYDGDDDGYCSGVNWSVELGGLLQSLKGTPLERLSLTSFASSLSLLRALREHGLPETLRHLDLSGSDLDRGGAEWIVENEDLFRQLDTLDLRETLINDARPLSALEPEVLHSSGGGAMYRFSVGME